MVDACSVITHTTVSGSCCEVESISSLWKSHVYSITSFCGEKDYCAQGFCESVCDGGGWLVIQRRRDNSVDFDRTWVE